MNFIQHPGEQLCLRHESFAPCSCVCVSRLALVYWRVKANKHSHLLILCLFHKSCRLFVKVIFIVLFMGKFIQIKSSKSSIKKKDLFARYTLNCVNNYQYIHLKSIKRHSHFQKVWELKLELKEFVKSLRFWLLITEDNPWNNKSRSLYSEQLLWTVPFNWMACFM